MNTRPPPVTKGPPFPVVDPRRSGSRTPFSSGWLRIVALPSPSGTCQPIVPLFRSIAVSVVYGGLVTGIGPSRLAWSGGAVSFEYSTSRNGFDPSFLPTRFTYGVVSARTMRKPVSASHAAPPQFAPPPLDGRCSVPRNPFGV